MYIKLLLLLTLQNTDVVQGIVGSMYLNGVYAIALSMCVCQRRIGCCAGLSHHNFCEIRVLHQRFCSLHMCREIRQAKEKQRVIRTGRNKFNANPKDVSMRA